MAGGLTAAFVKYALGRTATSPDLCRSCVQCLSHIRYGEAKVDLEFAKLTRETQQTSWNGTQGLLAMAGSQKQSCKRGSTKHCDEYRLKAMKSPHCIACAAFKRASLGVSLSKTYILSSAKPYSSTSICLRSYATHVDPPNISDLCEKARLSLTKEEVVDIEPQLVQIADWFAQLQDVDLENVTPSIRAGDLEDRGSFRSDLPEVFPQREEMLGAAPELQGPFLKVPKILKENLE